MSTLLQHDFILLFKTKPKNDAKALFSCASFGINPFADRPYQLILLFFYHN
jgi:hypothetical protein